MFPAPCVLLCLAVAATQQHVFNYVKPWDPFRRSATQCEMCYEGKCFVTRESRCEYYADASKLFSDDDEHVNADVHHDSNKIDSMVFELVHLGSSISQFKDCIPLVSQYTDCTEENICIGCTICSCDAEGRWICSNKQKCRPEPILSVDHRVVRTVVENLKRKEISHQRRYKRSASLNTKNIIGKSNSKETSELMERRNISIEEILEKLKGNETIFDEYRDNAALATPVPSGSIATTNTPIKKNDNYVDLEFNDILQSWRIEELSTTRPQTVILASQTLTEHRSEEININDVDYNQYDPIRLIKRDTSKLISNENTTIVQINSTRNNVTHEVMLTNALQVLNKITNEKQKELDDLLNVRNNLLNIAEVYNISIDMNSTNINNNYNKNHITIYALDSLQKCVAEVKRDISSAMEDVIKTSMVSNSGDLQRDLQSIFHTIRKYVIQENNKNIDARSSQVFNQNPEKYIDPHSRYQNNPIILIGNILVEINKAPGNPLNSLSQYTRKVLKRVVKQLYLDDFAIINYIVHETYYDFDSYLDKIGIKWNNMMQDISDSDIFDTLYRFKLLHMTLQADISKMEDMITLLDFARNRRMTIANGATIDKSIVRIQNNLQLIDSNVQKIIKFEKSKKLRKSSAFEKNKEPAKKKSILQKLKKMFQSSKNDIKVMLRKRFPKSEIMKQIAQKKIDELEKRRMLEYQETMKHWEQSLNVVPRRNKRNAWGFQAFADRIKSIIPGYLKGKVKPAIQRKQFMNKNHTTKRHGRKKKRRTRPTTMKTITGSTRHLV